MRQAVKLGMIPTSPADAKKLTLSKIVTPEVEIFTTQECTALIAMVQEEKKQLAAEFGTAWHEEDWILTQWDGTMMHKQTPSARFRKYLKKHGLKVRKFHALRHTSATLLLYSGVNIRQVQSRLGHGNITTTQRYLHAIKDADEEAVNALQNLLITQHKADAEAKRKAE